MNSADRQSSLRVLIADDEPLAIDALTALLASDPDVTVVGQCPDGLAAVARLHMEDVDIALLDMQMPGLGGLEIVRALDPQQLPLIVFVTAYDEYAVEAFEANAVDYVLKPVRAERLQIAIDRCKARIRQESSARQSERLTALLGEDAPKGRDDENAAAADRLIVRSLGRTIFLDLAQIDWIEAADYCARIHAGDHEYVIRESMLSLERRLPSENFLRTHRSSIVNIDRIAEITPTQHGDFEIRLHNGARVRLSRTRRAEVERRLGRRL